MLILLSICSVKLSLKSQINPKYFWLVASCTLELFNSNEGWLSLSCLWAKHISMTCLLGSGWNNLFHWKAYLLILLELLLSWVLEKALSLTFEKEKDISSANISHINSMPLGKN